ncbi:MAG: hypothetical protein AAGG51_30485 [Cyanobacteria bacterium P01_G01_bin.54]
MKASLDPTKTKPYPQQPQHRKSTPLNAEIIESCTPIVLAVIGGVIGIAVLVTSDSEAGFGLASTAIAGAAGLAQPHKNRNSFDDDARNPD